MTLDELERLLDEAHNKPWTGTRAGDDLRDWLLREAPRLLALARAGEKMAAVMAEIEIFGDYDTEMEAAHAAWKEVWDGT